MNPNRKKPWQSLKWYLLILIACLGAEVSEAELGVQFTQLTAWPGHLRGPGFDIKIEGDLAYVASGAAGLVIWDVTDTSKPVRIGGLDTLGSIGRVIVRGNYAYTIDSEEGFLVIDISTPTQPFRAGSYRTAGDGGPFDIIGNYAYLACGPTRPLSEVPSEGLLVLDISDPRFPHPVKNINFPTNPYWGFYPSQLLVSGDLAFVSARFNGELQLIYDISLPSPANLLWRSTNNLWGLGALRLVGTNLVYGVWDSLHVADIKNPSAPVVIGALPLNQHINDMEIRGQTVFAVCVADYSLAPRSAWGLHVVDLTDPTIPKQIGSNSIYENFTAIALNGNDALLTDSSGGLHVLDISIPSNPIYKTKTNLGNYAGVIHVADGYAYLGDENLEVFDLSEPAKPRWVSSHEPAASIAISGNIACTVSGTSFKVIDISDKTSLKTIGSSAIGGTSAGYYQVVISGSYAFARGFSYSDDLGGPTIHVYDISNPAAPRIINNLYWVRPTGSIAVENGRLYVGGQFTILDVADPAQARVLSRPAADYMAYIAVRGNYAFGVSGIGFQIMDVSDPARVSSVAKFLLPGPGWNIRLSGSYAYISGGPDIQVVDISDVTKPTWIGSYRDEGEPYDVAVVGDDLFIADGSAGLHVVSQRFGSAQRINFEIPKQIAVGGTVKLTATVDSGLPVSFSVVTGPATIEGDSLTITGLGEVRIRAEQAGNGTTLPTFVEAKINSPPVPDLQIRSAGDGIEFLWNGNDASTKLEKSAALGLSDWQDVIAPVERSMSQTIVRLPATNKTRFYRLRRD